MLTCTRCRLLRPIGIFQRRLFCNNISLQPQQQQQPSIRTVPPLVNVSGVEYKTDDWTSINSRILSFIGRDLHNQQHHPLGLLKQRIVNHMYIKYVKRDVTQTPLFSVFDRLSPVVSVEQNFDSLLIPLDHVSRKKQDCYYINKSTLLRGHMSAHQAELIRSGLDCFIIVGDVYRRDEIDSCHFPAFHQLDASRLYTVHELFPDEDGVQLERVFVASADDSPRPDSRQQCHTQEATDLIEKHMKDCIMALTVRIFGKDVQSRWVPAFFPFTHPSWELEILHNGDWMEMLGCGVLEHTILKNCGAGDRIGWAFGLGLERLAMRLYDIPDIRIFWSNDTGFLSQFQGTNPYANTKYKAVSKYPQLKNDMSFFLPGEKDSFHPSDFYDVARNVGGDIIEQIRLTDEFFHPKKRRWSQCYQIIYRHMERTLTQKEINEVHSKIAQQMVDNYGVELR